MILELKDSKHKVEIIDVENIKAGFMLKMLRDAKSSTKTVRYPDGRVETTKKAIVDADYFVDMCISIKDKEGKDIEPTQSYLESLTPRDCGIILKRLTKVITDIDFL